MRCMIVGCQRSGTTLLREILNSGELLVFDENWIAAYLYRERFHAFQWRSQGYAYDDDDTRIWDMRARQFLKYTYQSYFERERKPSQTGWGMKSPGLNMAYAIPFLAGLFKELKFIYMVRDPRDTYASMKNSEKMMNYLPGNFYQDSINSPDLVDLYLNPFSYWASVQREILKHREEMPERFHTIYFERLMESPLDCLEALCNFLQINFKEEMLEPFTRKISNSSVISMDRQDYLRGNFVLKRTAVGRWIRDLTPEEANQIVKHSRIEAEKLGYLHSSFGKAVAEAI